MGGVWWEAGDLERAAVVQAGGQVGPGDRWQPSKWRGERGGKQWNLENLATDLEM